MIIVWVYNTIIKDIALKALYAKLAFLWQKLSRSSKSKRPPKIR